MDSFFSRLRATIDTLLRFENQASKSWRLNGNRRTTYTLLFMMIVGTLSYLYLVVPPDAFPSGQLITVQEGQSVSEISTRLASENVIQSPLIFKLLLLILKRDRGARAGDYLFREPKNVWEVARAVSIGAYGLEPTKIRIHEGATTKEMAKIFSEQLLRFKSDVFIAAAEPEEGFLFPDTYFFLPNATEGMVIQSMRQNFEDHIQKLNPPVASSTHSLSEIITLASIIEREAHDAEDRRMISGVLWNRLKKNIPLQVDVTFLYTIGKGTFDLTMKDLRSDSPYNTYVHKGLPPGPIGSPSLDSIDAALHPTPSQYLYYLADRNGVTYFSKTYEEHLEKKHLYLGT